MTKYNKNIPEGTRDIVYGEVLPYEEITERLSKVYIASGFECIMTPTLEFYDVFDCDKSILPESMYKLTDRNGRLIVLRADNTTPIARVAATKLRSMDFPQKFYYNQPVFRVMGDHSGMRSEIFQSGVELLGAAGMKGDLICTLTALRALEALGLDFKLELGHVGYYNALIKELALEEEETERLRVYVEQKQMDGIASLGDRNRLEKIGKLPLLYGGNEIFSEAAALADGNTEALEALAYLESLYRSLTDAGFGDRVIIDMGIVHSIDYYTGTVFRGYIEGAGKPVLTGGRYDHLLQAFGIDCPATGFALNVGLAADTLMKIRPMRRSPASRILIHFTPENFALAEKYRRDTETDGISCEYSCFDSLTESISFAVRRGIPWVADVGPDAVSLTGAAN